MVQNPKPNPLTGWDPLTFLFFFIGPTYKIPPFRMGPTYRRAIHLRNGPLHFISLLDPLVKSCLIGWDPLKFLYLFIGPLIKILPIFNGTHL
jgi:hypothetical protein